MIKKHLEKIIIIIIICTKPRIANHNNLTFTIVSYMNDI
jgi:hypothetical protein